MKDETREETLKRIRRYFCLPSFGFEKGIHTGDGVEFDIWEWSLIRPIECPKCGQKAFCGMYLKEDSYRGDKDVRQSELCETTNYLSQSFHYCPECDYFEEGEFQKKQWVSACDLCSFVWDFDEKLGTEY